MLVEVKYIAQLQTRDHFTLILGIANYGQSWIHFLLLNQSFTLWKVRLNIDGQEVIFYQPYEQTPLTSNL